MLNKIICLFVFISPVFSYAEHRHHESHEHGAGTMNIALDGELLTIELEIPGNDIVGFEHAAKSDSDKAKVDSALKILNETTKIFSFVPADSCSLKGTPKIAFVAEAEDDDSHGHHGMHHGDDDDPADHTELKAEYLFSCKSVVGVTFQGFSQFPSIKELDAQVAFGNVQVSYELSPKEPTAFLEDRD